MKSAAPGRHGSRTAWRPKAAVLLVGFALPAGVGAILPGAASPAGQDVGPYFPGPGDAWQRRAPGQVGIDSAGLEAAVAFARAHESDFGRHMRADLEWRLGEAPYAEIVGPLKDRGEPSGLILRHGYIVAEWGDTRAVDMTFSVSKSFVSTVGGLALDQGLIRDLDDRVRDYVPGWFDSPHNASITWRHLFTQTSEWEGALWGKPDAADRRRGRERTLQPPGTFWEYNDVRVNLAALSLLHVWKRPLADVLRQRVMDPVGASDSWEWHGYRDSWATIDGRRLKSVSGGGHWGGGLWISTRDEARFGYLFLREGRWAGRRILSRDWVYAVRTPTRIQPGYGLMWWLNTDGAMWPGLPADSYAALGGGTNAIWVGPGDDLVVVVRWIDGASLGAFLSMVRHSIRVIREAPGR